ncbi:MAG: bifunctional metallophosphatase/5'-nucleotidase, partial [Pseudomonadota bacterium]|nr:bifunctional metallophosphatase/5'-nucleotidase [Pseudomonadota bacterium]
MCVAAFVLTCAATAASAQTVAVRIIAINDFHGHLEAGDNAIAVSNPTAQGGTLPLRSGGAAFLAARIAQLRTENPRNVVVSAG